MQFVDPGLKRQIFSWFSPRLGMEWPIVRYGDWGRALLIVPTAGGDFLEAERMFLIKAMEPFIFAGKLQVFCINSINPWAWMNDSVPVPESVRRQSLYSGYIEEEVVPHIRNCLQNPSARIGIGGASLRRLLRGERVLPPAGPVRHPARDERVLRPEELPPGVPLATRRTSTTRARSSRT